MRFFQVLSAAVLFGSPILFGNPPQAPTPEPTPSTTPTPSPTPRGTPLPPSPPRKDLFFIVSDGGADQWAGNATCSFDFQPSGSSWIAGLDESKVFHAVFQTEHLRLGIGKGGQIYSMRGPFGEGVPPQRLKAPWIDEVWHLVVTNEEIVTPIHKFQNADPAKNWDRGMPFQYFIHQAGVYLDGLTGTNELGAPNEPYYSPILESHWDPKTRTLFMANWAQMARSPNVWKSGALVLTAYRDLGDGAIEVTQSLTNFGTEDLTYLNAPWGGVRYSSLPQTVLSKNDGTWSKVDGVWGWTGIPKARFNETGGWIAWTSREMKESDPSLAMVFGIESEELPPWKRAPSLILYGTAGEAAVRDYNVVETSSSVKIKPRETLSMRWFLVAGSFDHTRKRAAELASKATMWMPKPETSLRLPVWIKDGKPSKTGEGNPTFHLYATPSPEFVPIFLMENTRNGELFATTEPHLLARTAPASNILPADHPEHALYENRSVYYQYESPGVLRGLLGYARKDSSSGKDEFFSVEGTQVLIKELPTPNSPAPAQP
jgi:hypothetical protein